MKIPNADKATVETEKLRDYLLDPEHPAGGSKAVLLITLGYERGDPRQLESDLRTQHLSQDFDFSAPSDYGMRYEICAPILTPRGRIVVFRSFWQIDSGTDVPRLLTLYPD